MADSLHTFLTTRTTRHSALLTLGCLHFLCVGCQQPSAQPTVVVVPTPSQGSFRAPPPVLLPKTINASNIVGAYVQDERIFVVFVIDRQFLHLPLAHCLVPRGKEIMAVQGVARALSNQIEVDWEESIKTDQSDLQVVLKYHNGFAKRNLARSITRELAGLTAP